MVVINNPFRRSSATAPKWRHRSTTMQMKLDDDENDSSGAPVGHGYYHHENSRAPQLLLPPAKAPYNGSDGNNSANSSTATRSKQQHNAATLTKTNPVSAETTTTAQNDVAAVPINSDSLLNGIGDYIFTSRLGDGKFSQVMLAEHHLTGEKVAIKIINKRAHQYRVMYRLVREIQLMEVLYQHPNIVTLYETYETADALYLVMEYVPGLNLEDYLKTLGTHGSHSRNRPAFLDEEKARHIFRQIVKAVDYCHSRWVVHRDLKTPNILLTGEDLNQVKIADFGLGNRYGLQRLKTVCGSMLYYSPEIIAARSYVGPEVDTWCLGILLFRMTAGTELFAHAKTPTDLKKYILCRQYRFPAHLSEDLQLTIQKCLSTDRANRLSLETMLSQDPWFTKNGALSSDDIFCSKEQNNAVDLSEIQHYTGGPSRLLYNAKEVTQSYAESFRSEDLNRVQISAQQTKKQCKQDLLLEEEEKRRQQQEYRPDMQHQRKLLFPCPKTVIYHITHPSTYFTSTTASIQSGDQEQTQIITELNQQLLLSSRRVHLRPLNEKDIPIKQNKPHVFRKSNIEEQQQQQQQHPRLRKAASVLSLFSQKSSKEHVAYFSIKPFPTAANDQQAANLSTSTTNYNHCTSASLASSTMISTSELSMSSSIINPAPVTISHEHTLLDSTSKRKSLSHRLSKAFLSHNYDERPLSHEEARLRELEEGRQQQHAIATLTRLLRHACDILGITYYQSSSSQLVCLLTLRNCKVKSSQEQKRELQQKSKSKQKKTKMGSYKKRLSRFLDNHKHERDNNGSSDGEEDVDDDHHGEETDASVMTTTAFTTSSLLKSKLFNNKKYSTISNMSRTTTLTMMTTATTNSVITPATSSEDYRSSNSNSNSKNSHLSKWWSKQKNRLSILHHQQQRPSALSTTTTATSTSASTTMVLGDSSYHTKSIFSSSATRKISGKKKKKEEEEPILIVESNNTDESTVENPDGFAILTIDISCLTTSYCNDPVLAIWYVRVKGSAKVFMLAKGWLQMVLSQNYDELGHHTHSGRGPENVVG